MSTVAVAGDGVELFFAAIILLVLTWITVLMRIGVRVWRKVFGADDYLMVAGQVRGSGAGPVQWSVGLITNPQVLFTVTAALCIVACYHGSGQRAKDLPPLTIAKGVKVRAGVPVLRPRLISADFLYR